MATPIIVSGRRKSANNHSPLETCPLCGQRPGRKLLFGACRPCAILFALDSTAAYLRRASCRRSQPCLARWPAPQIDHVKVYGVGYSIFRNPTDDQAIYVYPPFVGEPIPFRQEGDAFAWIDDDAWRRSQATGAHLYMIS